VLSEAAVDNKVAIYYIAAPFNFGPKAATEYHKRLEYNEIVPGRHKYASKASASSPTHTASYRKLKILMAKRKYTLKRVNGNDLITAFHFASLLCLIAYSTRCAIKTPLSPIDLLFP
jgi:hypothetical protein